MSGMGDHAFLDELFAPIGRVQLKRMFGGLGAFRDGLMFAIVIDEVIYLKTDDTTRPAFEAEGCAPFTYAKKTGAAVSLSYWRIPERLMDEPDELKAWALDAVAVAERAAAAKPAPARKKATGANAQRTQKRRDREP